MKRIAAAFLALTSLMTAVPAVAQNPVERGRELFYSKDLGRNGKSCASCHPNGSKLEEAASYDENQQVAMVNKCIKRALAGQRLAAGSEEMKAFLMYLRTFTTT